MRMTFREFRRGASGLVFAGALALTACAGPMSEGIRRDQHPAQQPITLGGFTVEGRMEPAASPTATSAVKQQAARVDPFALNERLQGIVDGLSGNDQAKVQNFFTRFHRGGSEGVTVHDMSGQAPRTASEALANGGDCTDLANFAIAVLRGTGVPGGAMVVHFNSAPAGVDHMVPYVELGGRRVVVDLQASTLGQTGQGRYSTLLTMTFDQAASMYFRELGDHHRDGGRSQEAIAAYRQAVEIFNGDAYVHQNLGVLYERAGDMESARSHLTRAGELDPRYRRDAARGSYNDELRAGQQAASEGRWADCVTHLQNALDSGESISADERRTIEGYRDTCRQNAASDGQKKSGPRLEPRF